MSLSDQYYIVHFTDVLTPHVDDDVDDDDDASCRTG